MAGRAVSKGTSRVTEGRSSSGLRTGTKFATGASGVFSLRFAFPLGAVFALGLALVTAEDLEAAGRRDRRVGGETDMVTVGGSTISTSDEAGEGAASVAETRGPWTRVGITNPPWGGPNAPSGMAGTWSGDGECPRRARFRGGTLLGSSVDSGSASESSGLLRRRTREEEPEGAGFLGVLAIDIIAC